MGNEWMNENELNEKLAVHRIVENLIYSLISQYANRSKMTLHYYTIDSINQLNHTISIFGNHSHLRDRGRRRPRRGPESALTINHFTTETQWHIRNVIYLWVIHAKCVQKCEHTSKIIINKKSFTVFQSRVCERTKHYKGHLIVFYLFIELIGHTKNVCAPEPSSHFNRMCNWNSVVLCCVERMRICQIAIGIHILSHSAMNESIWIPLLLFLRQFHIESTDVDFIAKRCIRINRAACFVKFHFFLRVLFTRVHASKTVSSLVAAAAATAAAVATAKTYDFAKCDLRRH